jgi:hypothetical protein
VGFRDRSLDLCLPCPYIIVYTSITRPGGQAGRCARVRKETRITRPKSYAPSDHVSYDAHHIPSLLGMSDGGEKRRPKLCPRIIHNLQSKSRRIFVMNKWVMVVLWRIGWGRKVILDTLLGSKRKRRRENNRYALLPE